MNKQQKMYALAKANLEALEEQGNAIELEYITKHGIINEDGSKPTLIYMIDNDEDFEKANAAVTKINEESGLWAEIVKAREYLKVCEENLLSYGLSLMPRQNDRERAILAKEVRENITARMKVIDLVMRLDVRTVKAAR